MTGFKLFGRGSELKHAWQRTCPSLLKSKRVIDLSEDTADSDPNEPFDEGNLETPIHDAFGSGTQVWFVLQSGISHKLTPWSLLPTSVCPWRTWLGQNLQSLILWSWNPITRNKFQRLLPLDRMNFGLPQIFIVTYCCWKGLLILSLRYANASDLWTFVLLIIPFSLQ